MKQKLDRLLLGGRIHTLKNEAEVVQALGVRDGRIAFAGSDADALARFDADEVVRLDGRTVVPGMGDSHMHFYAYCQSLLNVDLGPCRSKAEALERLRARAAETPPGQWIRGSNFDQTKWRDSADELPTRRDLDLVSTRHPIVIKRVCLHTATANSAALRLAGIFGDYVPKPGGVVEREPDGEPSGVLREQLTRVFDEIIPDPLSDPGVREPLMAAQLRAMASRGLTMMHTYAAEIWRYVEDAASYEALDRAGRLPLRVTVYQDRLEKLTGLADLHAAQRDDPRRKVSLGGYKLFCDGSLGSRSAALYEPYADDPGNTGVTVEDGPSLEEKMLRAARQGVQCAVHAIGDRALDIAVTAVEHTVRELGGPARFAGKPFRIIHAQMAAPSLVERLKRLPVVLDIQPLFLNTDMHWIAERIGPERMENAYCWQTYQKNGLLLTGGSDAPVESWDPLAGVCAAVTRQDDDGWPAGGFQPGERMSVYDALCMFSKNIPFATGDQSRVGTLEPGKFADLAVLERDIFSIPPGEIRHTAVLRTMLAGRDTWTA